MEILEFQETSKISLAELRENVPGFVAPQMYIYLDNTDLLEYIENSIEYKKVNIKHKFDVITEKQICIH